MSGPPAQEHKISGASARIRRGGRDAARGSSQPRHEEAARLVQWIKSATTPDDCGRTFDPGRVRIRRLNRTEFNNTIRDLVGIDFRAADDFPSDDVGYGFDNYGDMLSMPPILMEKYLAAAESISEEAILVTTSAKGMVKTYVASLSAMVRESRRVPMPISFLPRRRDERQPSLSPQRTLCDSRASVRSTGGT